MPRQTLILVHGMGQHTPESFRDEFVAACEAALALYPEFDYTSVGELFEIAPVGYNDIFEEHRDRMADEAQSMRDRLIAIGGVGNVVAEAVSRLSAIEQEFGDDGFFATHWLDVLFYRYTVLGERVRIRVGEAIAEKVAATAGGAANVHVLGHSLGTAVVHDTLAKLYSPDYVLGDSPASLGTDMHTLASVHMVANVSRVLESFVPVRRSVVRPGAGGCSAYYLQYRHRLDPITWPRPFTPTDNGRWISPAVWRQGRYLLKEPTSITHGNPHSIGHYLLNPLIHLDLFSLLFGFSPRAAQRRQALQRYQRQTLGGKAEQLEERLDELDLSRPGSVRDLVQAAIGLKDFVRGLGERFDL